MQFADRIKNYIRNIDMGVRYGGEEFVIIMPETDLSQAAIVAERIRSAVAGSPFVASTKTGSLEVTCSIGIASLNAGFETPEELIKRADAALYRAKHTGRNRVMHKGKPAPRKDVGGGHKLHNFKLYI